jgi:hypothetical protein
MTSEFSRTRENNHRLRLGGLNAPKVVLGLLCAMYLILHIDRFNIAPAAPLIKADHKHKALLISQFYNSKEH